MMINLGMKIFVTFLFLVVIAWALRMFSPMRQHIK
jgi:hypothetical protein